MCITSWLCVCVHKASHPWDYLGHSVPQWNCVILCGMLCVPVTVCACVLCCVKGKMCTPVTGSVCLDNAVYSRLLLSLCWKCCESVGLCVTESMYISVVLCVLLIMCVLVIVFVSVMCVHGTVPLLIKLCVCAVLCECDRMSNCRDCVYHCDNVCAMTTGIVCAFILCVLGSKSWRMHGSGQR